MEHESQAKRDGHEFTFDVPPEHIVLSSKGKQWEGIDVAEIVHPHDDFALPAISRHILVVNLGPAAEVQERFVGREGHLETGNLVILPAEAPSTWHLERQGEVRHLHLYLAPSFLHRVALEAEMNPDTVQLIETIGVSDPLIETIALAFLKELRLDAPGGKIYSESLANILAVQLLRQHSSVRLPSGPRTGKLAAATFKRVTDYIEEHLDQDLALANIAAVASLSPYHFARLFKASSGLSPHQYVIQRRIERAKELLTTTDWSLTTIAHAVGFASESHLALHFKRVTGLRPKYYRQ